MRVLVCSKRDLSSVVILNDLLDRLAGIAGCTIFLMLAERTRTVETVVAELVHMKELERDLPFGVLFPLIEGQALLRSAGTLAEIVERHHLPVASRDRRPISPASRLDTLNRLIARHKLPHLVVRSMGGEAVAAAETFAPDLILSARFSFIFPPPFIALAEHGVINVHPGRLPEYAGLYPHFHSMMAGEPALGCTVHVVDGGIDSGPILAAGEVPIDRRRSAFSHNLDSHLLGNRLAADVVKTLSMGERLVGVPQDRSRLRQHTYPTREEFQAFRAKRLSLIDMGEYLDLLRRFGLFDGIVSPDRKARLPESADSDRLTTTHRG